MHRSQLIATLNSNMNTSTSHPSVAEARPTKLALKTPAKPLRKADHPNVKHWDRRPQDKSQYKAIKVSSTCDDSDDEHSDESGAQVLKNRDRVFAFLEDENGELISLAERDSLYAEVRAWWNENIDASRVPQNWSSAGATLRDRFRDDIENKFFFLRLCSSHWKVDAIWKKNYHSWKVTFRSRVKKSTKDSCSSNSTKRGLSASTEHDGEDAGDESDEVRPRKKQKKDVEKEKAAMVRYVIWRLCFFFT